MSPRNFDLKGSRGGKWLHWCWNQHKESAEEIPLLEYCVWNSNFLGSDDYPGLQMLEVSSFSSFSKKDAPLTNIEKIQENYFLKRKKKKNERVKKERKLKCVSNLCTYPKWKQKSPEEIQSHGSGSYESYMATRDLLSGWKAVTRLCSVRVISAYWRQFT